MTIVISTNRFFSVCRELLRLLVVKDFMTMMCDGICASSTNHFYTILHNSELSDWFDKQEFLRKLHKDIR